MKVWAWDENGIIASAAGRELREDVLNGGYLPYADNETTDEPLACGEHQINRRVGGQGGKWVIADDYRGTWYSKTTREQKMITEVGEKPETSYTDVAPPAEMWYSWDDQAEEWVFDLVKYKAHVTSMLSEDSFNKCAVLFPQYKVMNIVSGAVIYDAPYTIENYRLTAEAFRTEYYRVNALITAATTQNGVDVAYSKASFPTKIITE